MKAVFWIGITFLYIVFAFLSFPVSLLPDRGRIIFYRMIAKALRRLFRLNLVNAEVKGLELIPKDRSLLFICGRPRKLMYYYVVAYFPRIFRIVADEQLCRLPLIGQVFRTIGCIPNPAKPGDKKAAWVFGGRLFSALKARQNLLFFYENLRGSRPEREERRIRVVEIARQAGAEIVPIVATSKGKQISKYIFANEKIFFEVKSPIAISHADKTPDIISKIETIFEHQK